MAPKTNIDDSHPPPPSNDLPEMFRPPINRAMRVLDRSFFQKKIPVSAAAIYKASDISNVRKELLKSRDMLALPRLNSIREVKDNAEIRRGILLREDVRHDGMRTLFWVGQSEG